MSSSETSFRIEQDSSSGLTFFLIRTLPIKSSPLRLRSKHRDVPIPAAVQSVSQVLPQQPLLSAGIHLISNPVTDKHPSFAAHSLVETAHPRKGPHLGDARVQQPHPPFALSDWHMVWIAKRTNLQSPFVHRVAFYSDERMLRLPHSPSMDDYLNHVMSHNSEGAKLDPKGLLHLVHMQPVHRLPGEQSVSATNLSELRPLMAAPLLMLGLVQGDTFDTEFLTSWVAQILEQQNKLHRDLVQTKIGNQSPEQQFTIIMDTLRTLQGWSNIFKTIVIPLFQKLVTKHKFQAETFETSLEKRFWDFYPKFLELARTRDSKSTIREAVYLRDCYLADIQEKPLSTAKINELLSSLKGEATGSKIVCAFIEDQFTVLGENDFAQPTAQRHLMDPLHKKIASFGTQLRAWLTEPANSRFKTVLHQHCFATFGRNSSMLHLNKDFRLFGLKISDLTIMACFQSGPSLLMLAKLMAFKTQEYQFLRVQKGAVRNTLIFQHQFGSGIRSASVLYFSGTNLLQIDSDQHTPQKLTVYDCTKLFDVQKPKSELQSNDRVLHLQAIQTYSFTADYFVHIDPNGIHLHSLKRTVHSTTKTQTIGWSLLPKHKKASLLNPSEKTITKVVCSATPNQLVLVTLTRSSVQRLVYFKIDPTDLKPTMLACKHPNLILPDGGFQTHKVSSFHVKGVFYVSVHDETRSVVFTLHRGVIQQVRINNKRTQKVATDRGIELSSVTQPPGYVSGVYLKAHPDTCALSLHQITYRY